MSVMLRGFLCLVFVIGLSGLASGQAWKTDVGYTKLLNDIGSGLETGVGVDAMWVEAPSQGNYFPDIANQNFLSKNFVYGSGPSGTSNHANGVCTKFFGSSASIAPELGDDIANPVTGFDANDWINFGLAYVSQQDVPLQPYHVSNHSYIANLSGTFTEPVAVNLLERLDFAINQSGMLAVVGTNNGNNSTQLPALWVHGYNCLTVGVTDGSHASSINNPTYLYGNGRIKPEIVAPWGTTSGATPMIASGAALLHEAGAGTDSVQPETLKAILLAGATKDEFASWTRTPLQPLDKKFGAGEMNICNSYYIQQGGEFDGATGNPATPAGLNGWDYEPLITSGSNRYFELVVPENTVLEEMSLILTWNMEITDVNPGSLFAPVQSLANMNLNFYDSDNGFTDLLVDSSDSPVDNIEHVYRKYLMPGTYHICVGSDMDMDYGIAWRSTTKSAPFNLAFGRKFLDGVAAGGQLTDALSSDDVYYELDPSPTNNPIKQKIELILLGETTITNPEFFSFRVEASMIGGPEGDVIQTVELWNETDKVWELADNRAATNTDSVVKFAPGGDLTRFIHPLTSEIIAKVTWVSPEFTVGSFFWSVDLDQAVWQICD